MIPTVEPCELLPWDTQFFGVTIARVNGDTLTPETVETIDRWCEARGVACLYFLGRSDDAETVRLAETRGFQLVDVRMTLETSGGMGVSSMLFSGETHGRDAHATIRPARPGDIPALRGIARVSHADTRFFFDPRFPRGKCESLYETWIQSSCEGFAKAVLVVEEGGIVAGYVTCHLTADGQEGSIGLIAIGAAHQGKGLGRQLVAAAIKWFAARAVRSVSVVTQGRNIAAQRLYARCGFIPRQLHLYYHHWFTWIS